MKPAAETAHDHVGPYQLVKAIGAGGSARVDLARIDRAYGFQRHVVIKRPLEHLRAEAKAADSLQREARLGGRLRHPNLVSVLDAGRHDGYDYIVLEYVHGGSLRTLMQHDDPARVHDVPLEVALAIVRDVARGLHDAHELADEKGAPLGLVHRDVSPGNVLIGLDGAVKLADFGIAKETRVATLSGSMHGTVTYMAPEQCRGHAFDRRADIFSLGVILYELVTGQRLFWADNDVASLHRVLAGNVPRARKVKPGVPAALDDLIMSAVAHDPLRRLGTAKSLADELEAFGAGGGLILASRHVAAWVHDLLGPRDAPWVGSATVVDQRVAPPPGARGLLAETEPDLSAPLVDLIAAAPADEDPPAQTFGPTDPSAPVFDQIDTQPDRGAKPTSRSARRVWMAVFTVGIAAGIGGALMYLGDDRPASEPPTAEPTQPIPSAPVPVPVPVPAIDPPTQPHEIIPALEEEADIVTEEPAGSDSPEDTSAPPDRATKHRRHHGKKPTAAKTTVVKSAEPKGSAAPLNAGSAAIKPPKVEWNPTMLLPTDKGSGTKQ